MTLNPMGMLTPQMTPQQQQQMMMQQQQQMGAGMQMGPKVGNYNIDLRAYGIAQGVQRSGSSEDEELVFEGTRNPDSYFCVWGGLGHES